MQQWSARSAATVSWIHCISSDSWDTFSSFLIMNVWERKIFSGRGGIRAPNEWIRFRMHENWEKTDLIWCIYCCWVYSNSQEQIKGKVLDRWRERSRYFWNDAEFLTRPKRKVFGNSSTQALDCMHRQRLQGEGLQSLLKDNLQHVTVNSSLYNSSAKQGRVWCQRRTTCHQLSTNL